MKDNVGSKAPAKWSLEAEKERIKNGNLLKAWRLSVWWRMKEMISLELTNFIKTVTEIQLKNMSEIRSTIQ